MMGVATLAPLAANEHALAVGGSAIVTSAADVGCNVLLPTGAASKYVMAVYNTSSSPVSTAAFQVASSDAAVATPAIVAPGLSRVSAGGPAVLGYPVADDGGTGDGTGALVRFQGGDVYWSPATSTQVVSGAMAKAYWDRGGSSSTLGFPTRSSYAASWTSSSTPCPGATPAHSAVASLNSMTSGDIELDETHRDTLPRKLMPTAGDWRQALINEQPRLRRSAIIRDDR